MVSGQPRLPVGTAAAGGGTPGPATKIERDRGETMHGWPFFLPDGERFVFIAFRSDDPPEIRLGQLGTFETRRLTEGDSRVEYVAPGYLVFERGGTLLAQPFDAEAGTFAADRVLSVAHSWSTPGSSNLPLLAGMLRMPRTL